MSTVRQRLFVCLIAIVMVFGVVVSAAPNIAYAESGELNYDKTSVMDDLTSSTARTVRRRSSISWSIATRIRAICKVTTGCMSMCITRKG